MSGPTCITRRTAVRALALLATAPIALAVVPSTVAAAPDPVDVAVAELTELSALGERVERCTGDGSGLLLFARGTVSLRADLVAAHGEGVGRRIWREAMGRHYRWMGERYGIHDG